MVRRSLSHFVVPLVIATCLALGTAAAVAPANDVPYRWAYPPLDVPVKLPPVPPEDGIKIHLRGSTVGLSKSQIANLFDVPDWYPQEHPLMPDIVAHGKKPNIIACGYCHMANGLGKPEDASLAGLSVNYILEQIADFKSGARKSFDPKRAGPIYMTAIAKSITDDEAKAAAKYFSSLRMKPRIKVIEATLAPKVEVGPAGMYIVKKNAGTEPLGGRIVEVPESQKLTDSQDSHSGFIAYVPVGSIGRGKNLVTFGGGYKAPRCAACHGADLRGSGNVPPIAGRSPSSLFRDLYDIQQNVRTGTGSAPMKSVVAGLSTGDLVAIVAYLASRSP